jgi:hypothetical protein
MTVEVKPDGKMALSHDPVPPYRRVFYVVLLVAVVYLVVIFGRSLM